MGQNPINCCPSACRFCSGQNILPAVRLRRLLLADAYEDRFRAGHLFINHEINELTISGDTCLCPNLMRLLRLSNG